MPAPPDESKRLIKPLEFKNDAPLLGAGLEDRLFGLGFGQNFFCACSQSVGERE